MKLVHSRRSTAPRRPARPKAVHQFLVVLQESDPLVWRRIQVPEAYTFWDLHVGIQDAMGWEDCHLQRFRVVAPDATGMLTVGIPMPDEVETERRLAGWEVPISEVFGDRNAPPAVYAYDFGDDWTHALLDEGLRPAERGTSYPRCVAGERRCPPEDCGGVDGYRHLLAALRDPEHEEHETLLEWVGGAFDPNAFDPAAVTFDSPKRRWTRAFRR